MGSLSQNPSELVAKYLCFTADANLCRLTLACLSRLTCLKDTVPIQRVIRNLWMLEMPMVSWRY